MAAASLGMLTGNHRDHALVDTSLKARFTGRGRRLLFEKILEKKAKRNICTQASKFVSLHLGLVLLAL